ncbi:hypothetical protein DSECCO2_621460 [anaerobic digester metagenome]
MCNKNVFGVAIFYDNGFGFVPENSQMKTIRDGIVKFELHKTAYIKNLRIDFQNLKYNDTVTMNSIKINNFKQLNYNLLALALLINIIFLSINFTLLKNEFIRWRIIYVIILFILLYILDSIIINDISFNIKLVSFICIYLMNMLMYFMTKELSENDIS